MISGIKSLYRDIKNDIISYINEYGFKLIDKKEEVYEEARLICSYTKQYDVVVMAKEGCGFCEKAKELLAKQQELQRLTFAEHHSTAHGDNCVSSPGAIETGEASDRVFTVKIVIGTNSITKTALGLLLNISDITFPQIICNGVYIGGADNLSEWIDDGHFAGLINTVSMGDRTVSTLTAGESNPSNCTIPSFSIDNSLPRIPWFAPLQQQASKPDLFKIPHVANAWYPRWSWYAFQWCMYSNLVRYISILQLCIMIPIAILFYQYNSNSNSNSISFKIAYCLLILLLVDLSVLVLHGPAPFSPSGTISTYFGWKIRGNATSAIPYKVVFAAYIFVLFPLLLLKKYSSIYSAMLGFIINSSLLVIFRF